MAARKCVVRNTRTGEKVGTFGSLTGAQKKCDQLNKEYGGRGGWFDVDIVKSQKKKLQIKG